MGRYSTGAWANIECKRIELSYLIKMGWIKKGGIGSGPLSWSTRGEEAGSILITAKYTEEDKYVRVQYTATREGEAKDFDTKINLVAIPSNLGKGEILYFLCPRSGTRCRILYFAYGLQEFISREAYWILYGRRIYYESQMCSKMERFNIRYWRLDRALEIDAKKRQAKTYKGVLTMRKVWREKTEIKRREADSLRWLILDSRFRKEELRGAYQR